MRALTTGQASGQAQARGFHIDLNRSQPAFLKYSTVFTSLLQVESYTLYTE